MKKKTEKRLIVSRETLRGLEEDDLKEAAGGSCLTCLPGTCGCPGWETEVREA
jgi:hypothetical protein